MTLDEAIKHAEEVTDKKKREKQKWDKWLESDYDHRAVAEKVSCELCAEEHRQLAEWLKDYKRLLEQEPCEDCISRQATVERLCKVAEFMNEKRNGLGSPYVMAALFIQDNKDEFPSVNPIKPKTGHWIKISPAGIYECSECQQNVMTSDICAYKYCHGCGARMSEVSE